jgi:ABC-type multidrug transport system fused ATPase/permease subunit
MTNFYRVLHFAWPYRARFLLSLLCAFGVALLWGGNLSAVYPVLKVLFHEQSIPQWVRQEASRQSDAVRQLERTIRLYEAAPEHYRAHHAGPDLDAELAEIRTELAGLRIRLKQQQWQLAGTLSLRELVRRFVPESRYKTLVLVLALTIGGMAVSGLLRFFNEWLVGGVTQLAIFDLRNQFYRHTLRMDLSSFTERGSAELMARFTNDVENIAVGVETLLGKVIREPLRAIFCLVFACLVNWRLTLLVIGLVPLAVLLMSSIGRTMRRATKRYLESMSLLYRILQESFQGIKTVKAFTMEPYERHRFFQEAKGYYQKSMRIIRLEAIASPTMELIGVLTISVALLSGAYLVISQSTHLLGVRMASVPMSPESLTLLYAFLAGVSDPVRKLSNVYGRVQRAVAAADRLFAFLDREPAIQDKPQASRLARHHRAIEFDDVSFRYPGSGPVLRNVRLHVPFGETIAVVGPNGSGKTTLISLIPRFYDVESGSVRIDGIDVRDVQQRSLCQQIGIVTQEIVLFNDTVYNNIRYGNRHASRADIEAAARRAHAHRFVSALPQGYDTIVGEHATKLSGGQRQRVALARAILRDPAILILDEATSALDVESEALLQRVLEEFKRGRTTFLVTHRLSALQMADRIVVMNEGQIQDVGTHVELMRCSPLYARLHEIHTTGSATPTDRSAESTGRAA